MKFLGFILLWISVFTCGQIPSYYNGINFNQSKAELKSSLSLLLKQTHHRKLSYTPGVWDALKVLDLNPEDNSQVLLIYGSNDEDNLSINDRTRSKNLTCNQSTCSGRWNREHVYPKSTGEFDYYDYAYSDVHALRASDTKMNSLRYNSPFVDGEGEAKEISSYRFYPGDEWKGDVARMILYMYLRYPNFCKPNYVGIDSHNFSAEIPDIFLEWNVEDPVSEFEIRRNNLIESEFQGNRNPFIDNPYLATFLWGGPEAEDTWNMLTIENEELKQFKLYPNPTQNSIYYHDGNFTRINVYDEAGSLVLIDKNLEDHQTKLPQQTGIYFIEFCNQDVCKSYQVIKN